MENRSALFGVTLMLVSGFGFTCSILFASQAIRGGIDIGTSNVLRYFIAAMLLWAWHAASGTPVRINLRERYAALGLGFAVFLMGAGYLGERLSPGQLAGAGLVVVAIILITSLSESGRQRDTSL